MLPRLVTLGLAFTRTLSLPPPVSFSASLAAAQACAGVEGGPPQRNMPVLNYTLSPGAALGVVDHVYSMSYPEGVALVQAGLKVEIRIWVDGETVGERNRAK